MANAARRKGLDAEREVALIYQAAGFEVRGLEGQGDHLIACVPGLTIHSEVKRQETLRIPLWWGQAVSEAPQGTVPVLAFRQNRTEWLATLRLHDLVRMIATVQP